MIKIICVVNVVGVLLFRSECLFVWFVVEDTKNINILRMVNKKFNFYKNWKKKFFFSSYNIHIVTHGMVIFEIWQSDGRKDEPITCVKC